MLLLCTASMHPASLTRQHVDLERLLAVLFGEAPIADLVEALDHLEVCARCAAELDILVQLRAHREAAMASMARSAHLPRPGGDR